MKVLIKDIFIAVFPSSVLVYIIGRTFFRNIITDDVGDWFLWSGGISLFGLLCFHFNMIQMMLYRIQFWVNAVSIPVIIGLSGFGLWGFFTKSGNKHFSEMAALFPYYVLILAGVLAVVVLVLNLVWYKLR